MRRVFWLVAAALLLAGCAGEKGIVEKEGYQLDTRRQAQAAYPRIKVLVIHYTADDFDSSLATLTNKQVSSHYLVPAVPPRYNGKPRIWQLVPDKNWPGMRGLAPGAGQLALTTPLLALSWKTVAGRNRRE
ncbi:putative N-acetylmuramoyl-L-alanine amidase [Escherichia coli]|nr:putative N-acetylmuramoyl-L-alanine amidase [Escherichia coli]